MAASSAWHTLLDGPARAAASAAPRVDLAYEPLAPRTEVVHGPSRRRAIEQGHAPEGAVDRFEGGAQVTPPVFVVDGELPQRRPLARRSRLLPQLDRGLVRAL